MPVQLCGSSKKRYYYGLWYIPSRMHRAQTKKCQQNIHGTTPYVLVHTRTSRRRNGGPVRPTGCTIYKPSHITRERNKKTKLHEKLTLASFHIYPYVRTPYESSKKRCERASVAVARRFGSKVKSFSRRSPIPVLSTGAVISCKTRSGSDGGGGVGGGGTGSGGEGPAREGKFKFKSKFACNPFTASKLFLE